MGEKLERSLGSFGVFDLLKEKIPIEEPGIVSHVGYLILCPILQNRVHLCLFFSHEQRNQFHKCIGPFLLNDF